MKSRNWFLAFGNVSVSSPGIFHWARHSELHRFGPFLAKGPRQPAMSTSYAHGNNTLVGSTPHPSLETLRGRDDSPPAFPQIIQKFQLQVEFKSSPSHITVPRINKNATLLQRLASRCSASNAVIKSRSQVWKDMMHVSRVAMQRDLRLS